MRIRVLAFLIFLPALAASLGAASDAGASGPPASARHAGAYQGRNRGNEQTERISRKVRLTRNGSVSINNISGDIIVNAGSSDDVIIEAVKHSRHDQLDSVAVDVNAAPNRVDIRTRYSGRSSDLSVDFTVTVPASASVELHSVSGDIKVTGVQGSVRVETVSGDVAAGSTPHLEAAKSVSGDVSLTDAGGDGDISIGVVSGTLHVKGLKARGLEVGSVSGDIILSNVTCERVGAKSVSGEFQYDGALPANARFNVITHSGSVKLTLVNPGGFELDASTFSGTIDSNVPLTIGGSDRTSNARRRGMSHQQIHASFGDASAVITIRTFSGDIAIQKR